MSRSLSIGSRLRLLSILTSGTALLAASLALLVFQLQEVRTDMLRRLETVADILAFNSAAAVDFNDADAATTMLAALKTRPGVLSAGIVARGNIFATYVREGAKLPEPALLQTASGGYRFTDRDLTVYRPVTSKGSALGTLFIQSDLREIDQTFRRFSVITGVVAIPALLIAILISLYPQRRISRPILNLAALAEVVSEKRDYSIRAPTDRSATEIEQLVATFNQMLAEIQQQNARLEEAHATLEHRVAERTHDLELRSQELETQGHELDAANKELEAFSYSVSHDLRAPLRAIDGFSKALLEDYPGKTLDERGLHYLERVRVGTQRMASLIDDLLNLSRVTRSTLQRRETDVTAIAEAAAAELARRHPDRRVNYQVQPGLRAFADSHLITIVLENLLGNAWKFSANVPDARIEIGRQNNGDDSVFYVRDNGAGFDMAYADKLFGAFQRLHSDSEFEGTGIGLATVQRIIHRHGGRIWAVSEQGKGATFSFTLGGERERTSDSSGRR
jgi:signal transduction histidine kinase